MADVARGEKLRTLRTDRHLSQEDAAHEIGVSTKSLRAWEKGGKITWKNAQAAARFYNVEAETLVSREGTANGSVPVAAPSEDTPPWAVEISAQLAELRQDVAVLLRYVGLREAEAAADEIPPPDTGESPARTDELDDATGS